MSGNLNDINQFSTIDANNTNIEGIDTAAGWSPSNVGPAFRALMGRLARVCQGLAPWNQVLISGAAATVRPFQLQTAGVARWQIDANATAEGGSNAGSDFELWSYTDAGAQLTKVMSITRSTGVTTFSNAALGATTFSGAVTLGSNSITGSDFVITGGSVDGTPVGGTTPAAGAFTTLSASSTISGAGFTAYLASPPAIGSTAPAAGAFTTLSASSTVSGAAFSAYLASPPAIGGTAPAAGAFTTISATGQVTVPAATASGSAVNLSQSMRGATLSNQTSSRVIGTVYTNSASRPMILMATIAGDDATISIQINSVTVIANTGYGGTAPVGATAFVPPGATYQVAASAPAGTPVLSYWYEAV